MQAARILLDRPFRYSTEDRDWEFYREQDHLIHPGEELVGHVEFDTPGKPPAVLVEWHDSLGRLVRTAPAKFDAAGGFAFFRFDLTEPLAIVNTLRVRLGGKLQRTETEVIVCPVDRGWDTYHVFTWAVYPYGYYEQLRELGVDGIIAYKDQPIDQILAANFAMYGEQVSPYELAFYHRPYFLKYEVPEKMSRDYKAFYAQAWEANRQRYIRVRAKCGDKSVAADWTTQKILWSDDCLNDPDVLNRAKRRLERTIRKRRKFRPTYYTLADEPGITDQTAPFDFCFCPYCTSRMRDWLRGVYGTLAGLNAEWATNFSRWRDVLPDTTDDAMRRYGKDGKFNFASWADHRTFMEITFARAHRELTEHGRSIDPAALFALEGGQAPAAFGGWDYARFLKSIDCIEMYNLGNSDEIIRSFAPDMPKLLCYFGDSKRQPRVMWYQLFHGDRGQMHWDWNEPKGRFLDRPTRKPTRRAKMLQPTLRELTAGVAEQVLAARRLPEAIGIHYSHPSIHAHWMLENLPRGEDWVNLDSEDTYKHNRLLNVRGSWVRLVEDAHRQHKFVSYDQIESGRLAAGDLKMLILPQSVALSDKEALEIENFVARGGVLVADSHCGRMDDHCKLLARGRLDHVFGIKCGEFAAVATGGQVRVTPPEEGASPTLPLAKGAWKLRVIDKDLKLDPKSRAVAMAACKETPAVVINRYGSGTAVYLNLDLAAYATWRTEIGGPRETQCRELIEALLDLAAVPPVAEVRTAEGERPPGWEITGFADGRVRLFGLTVNEVREQSGIGDDLAFNDQAFEQVMKVDVTLPAAGHVYDSRAGRYIGSKPTFSDRLYPMRAKLYAVLPKKVTSVTPVVKVSGNPRVATCTVKLTGTASGVRHVVRFDVYEPKGKWRPLYSANVHTSSGTASHEFVLADSDAAGTWRLAVRDALTGLSAERTFRVKK